MKGKSETNTDTQNQNQEVEEDRGPLKRVREVETEPETFLRSLMSKDKKNMTANSIKDRRSQDEHRDKELLDFTAPSAIISNP